MAVFCPYLSKGICGLSSGLHLPGLLPVSMANGCKILCGEVGQGLTHGGG